MYPGNLGAPRPKLSREEHPTLCQTLQRMLMVQTKNTCLHLEEPRNSASKLKKCLGLENEAKVRPMPSSCTTPPRVGATAALPREPNSKWSYIHTRLLEVYNIYGEISIVSPGGCLKMYT